jgi:sodium/potassium/calcium exchanger 6
MRNCALANILLHPSHCAYVRQHCDDNGIFNLYYINYCLVNEYYLLTLLITILLLAMCFNLLSKTADTYLSPLLAKLSQDLKLPETVAGVTLLAFSNGAPDVIASFSAGAESEGIFISIGALFGSGLFSTTIILARCIEVSKNNQIKVEYKSWVRDLSFYIFGILVV